mgnify:CR=1 FL=1
MLNLDDHYTYKTDVSMQCPDILVVDEAGSSLSSIFDDLPLSQSIGTFTATEDIKKLTTGIKQPSVIVINADKANTQAFRLLIRLKQQKQTESIPVIFVSNEDSVEKKVRAFSHGCDDYITLPMHHDEICARITSKIRALFKQRDIRRLAYHDELTDLLNRRGYNEALSKEWARSKRSKNMISMLLVDIDNFKSFNDSFGHQQGDHLIIAAAQALDSVERRSTDVLARFGGDEFVFLLTDCDFNGCINIANKAIDSFNTVVAEQFGEEVAAKASISIGIACLTPEAGNNTSTLFEQADSALYAAKKKGKNCWQIA